VRGDVIMRDVTSDVTASRINANRWADEWLEQPGARRTGTDSLQQCCSLRLCAALDLRTARTKNNNHQFYDAIYSDDFRWRKERMYDSRTLGSVLVTLSLTPAN